MKFDPNGGEARHTEDMAARAAHSQRSHKEVLDLLSGLSILGLKEHWKCLKSCLRQ